MPAPLAAAVTNGAAEGGGAPEGTAGASLVSGGTGSLLDGGTTFSLPDGTYFGDGSAAGAPPPPPARPLQDVSLRSMAGAPMTLSAAQSTWPDLIGLQAQARSLHSPQLQGLAGVFNESAPHCWRRTSGGIVCCNQSCMNKELGGLVISNIT